MSINRAEQIQENFNRAVANEQHPITAEEIKTYLYADEKNPIPEDLAKTNLYPTQESEAVNPNIVYEGRTALMRLAEQGNDEAMQPLIEYERHMSVFILNPIKRAYFVVHTEINANEIGEIDEEDKSKVKQVLAALQLLAAAPAKSKEKRLATFDSFAKKQADFNISSPQHPKTPLIIAAEAGILENVEGLLKHRVDSRIEVNGLTARGFAERKLQGLGPDADPTVKETYKEIIQMLDENEKWRHYLAELKKDAPVEAVHPVTRRIPAPQQNIPAMPNVPLLPVIPPLNLPANIRNAGPELPADFDKFLPPLPVEEDHVLEVPKTPLGVKAAIKSR